VGRRRRRMSICMCMSWGMGIKTARKDRVRSNNGRRRERKDRRERERERKQVQETICAPKMRKRWKDTAAPPPPADRKCMYLRRLGGGGCGWAGSRVGAHDASGSASYTVNPPQPQSRAPRPPRPHPGSRTSISWISSLLRSGFASPSS
jgi:hypothetical protein